MALFEWGVFYCCRPTTYRDPRSLVAWTVVISCTVVFILSVMAFHYLYLNVFKQTILLVDATVNKHYLIWNAVFSGVVLVLTTFSLISSVYSQVLPNLYQFESTDYSSATAESDTQLFQRTNDLLLTSGLLLLGGAAAVVIYTHYLRPTTTTTTITN